MATSPARPSHSIHVFSRALLLLWIGVAAVTVTLEVIPAEFHPLLLYSYLSLKVLLFFVCGYLTPLTFWRFDKLSLGLCFAAASAMFVEALQRIIGNGHRFSWGELLAKLGLIGFGFILALDARYERAILLGRLRFQLIGKHLPEQ
jgi:hypothetical protein